MQIVNEVSAKPNYYFCLAGLLGTATAFTSSKLEKQIETWHNWFVNHQYNGKTSLGKALLRIFKFIGSGNTALLFEMTASDTIGSFCIDFINAGYVLHRLSAAIDGKTESVTLTHAYTKIGEKDTYEKCAKWLDEGDESIDADSKKLKKRFGAVI